jgi:ankyrin repeat protein
MNSGADGRLIVAASIGDVPEAREAIKAGARINCTSDLMPHECVTPLMLAVHYQHQLMVRYLIAAGGDVNRRARAVIPDDPSRETALHWAVRQGNRRICQVLIAAGADIEAESTWGSVLQYAIESNNLRTVKTILRAGPSVNRPSGREKYLPLHIAAREGNPGIVKLLLREGARPAPHPISGQTPLIKACMHSRGAVVSLLLAAGDDPEQRDKWERRTPLMWAASSGDERCIRSLLRQKVDMKKRDAEGKTAWEIAQELNQPAAAYWIEKAGGGP